jgi:hypothetical protein
MTKNCPVDKSEKMVVLLLGAAIATIMVRKQAKTRIWFIPVIQTNRGKIDIVCHVCTVDQCILLLLHNVLWYDCRT